MKPPVRLREVVRVAESVGWTFDITGGQHPRLTPPSGQRRADGKLQAPITFGLTPSDWRADQNAFAALRRAGVPLRPEPAFRVEPRDDRFVLVDKEGAVVLNANSYPRTFRSREAATRACKRLCADLERGADPPMTAAA